LLYVLPRILTHLPDKSDWVAGARIGPGVRVAYVGSRTFIAVQEPFRSPAPDKNNAGWRIDFALLNRTFQEQMGAAILGLSEAIFLDPNAGFVGLSNVLTIQGPSA
jgi:hypothetical protein